MSFLSTETASILIEAHNLNCRSNLKPQSRDSLKWGAQESSFASFVFHILPLFVSCRSTANKRFFVNAYLPSMRPTLSLNAFVLIWVIVAVSLYSCSESQTVSVFSLLLRRKLNFDQLASSI